MADKIKCPNCGHNFDVEEALSGKIEAHFKSEYEKKIAEQSEKFNAEKKLLETEKKELSELKEKQDALLKEELAKALAVEKNKIEKSASEKFEEQIKTLKEENEKRKSENLSLKEKEITLIKKENELKEKQEELKFQLEKKLLEEQKKIKADYDNKFNEQLSKINNEKEKIEKERQEINNLKEKQNELIKLELEKALDKEKEKIEKTTLEQYENKMKMLQEDNDKRKLENKILKEKEVELMRKESELKEKHEELQITLEKQLLEKQKEIEDKARLKERESFELEKLQLLKQIEDNKKLAEEMKRKAEQGSMQMQGEVQEIALEKLLSTIYPFDKIDEVPKGIRGADCIQTVINNTQQSCGSIVYESKRTKSFANDWIDKLKQDQLACKADIAVIVTETMPNDMERFGERNGVWICGFNEVKSLSFVLREMLIKTQNIKKSQENKGDKMELLYNYLTSNEFVQNIKRIVENYDAMVNQLNSEKKAILKIWATREKQIWVVQENIAALFGSIKGIAGNELETSNVLQLPETIIEE